MQELITRRIKGASKFYKKEKKLLILAKLKTRLIKLNNFSCLYLNILLIFGFVLE